MGPQMSSAPATLWVLGCLALVLWLWVLCTGCHRYGAVSRGPTSLPCPQSLPLLRPPHLCSLSKSDTRLHELCRSPPGSPRPVSMDLLRLQCLEGSRGTTRPQAAFSQRELPRPGPAPSATQPSISHEATYSNVGLAAIPRASLAASPVVWAGARLTRSCARPGPEARSVVAEYACIQKLKGAGLGPQGLEQGRAEGTPAIQVDILYSRVNKQKRRDPEPATDQQDLRDGGVSLTRGSNLACEAPPLRGLSVDKGLLENVYESIQEIHEGLLLPPYPSA
uniref:Lck interacting transmembrane adaptor 1 n=1 Tax=Rhinolophus ferrumequinum TaxID=59479 RepID=A0A671EZ70_RHIFE